MKFILLLLLVVLSIQCGSGEYSKPANPSETKWVGQYLHGGFGPGLEVHLELYSDFSFKCSGMVHHGKALFVEGEWEESGGWIRLIASEIPSQYQSILVDLKQCIVNDERVLLPGGDETALEGGRVYVGAFWEGDEPRIFEGDMDGSWSMTYGSESPEDS